jgi:hypothetical protein
MNQEPPKPDYSQPPTYGQAPYPPQPPNAFERIIPAKNVKALLAYYFGVFSLVPCFTPFLGPAAIVLGILGLRDCNAEPNLPGRGHAITGIVLGSLTVLVALALVLVVIVFGRRT